MSRASAARGAVVTSLLATCCAAPPPTSEQLGKSVVVTQRAPGTDFGEFKTYYLRPEVRVLSDDTVTDTVDADVADVLLNQTKKNMNDRGYQEADTQADADLGVEMMGVSAESTSVWCYSWYDPYYWGYPSSYYYPYYGDCSGAQWQSNFLATIVVDLADARGGAPPPV